MTSRTLLATAALAALLPLGAFADSGASALARTGVAGNGAGGGTYYSWNIQVPHGAYGGGQSATSVFSASGTATTATATSADHGEDAAGAHSATSLATSNLGTGTVSASETNSGNDIGGRSSYGQPTSEIWDVLTFNVAGATASTTSTFDVTFTVHSNLALLPGDPTPAAGSYINPTLFIGREARNNFYVGSDGGLLVANDNYPTNWDDGVWTTTGSGSDKTFTFTGSISFQGASYTTKMDEALTMYCYDGAECSSTASVAVGLGANMTMSSESGAFLTAGSPSAVPEPANALLLLGGLGALALVARRRLATPNA
jgi:hypothetical protein